MSLEARTTPVKLIRDKLFGRFVAERVKMKDVDRKLVIEVIDEFIRRIGVGLSDSNPVYITQPCFVGSYYKGTKVQSPDEFDINIELKPFKKQESYVYDSEARPYGFYLHGKWPSASDMAVVCEENDLAVLKPTRNHVYLDSSKCTFVKVPLTGDGQVHPLLADVAYGGDIISYKAHGNFRRDVTTFITDYLRSPGRDPRIQDIEIRGEYPGPAVTLITSVKLQNGSKEIKKVDVDLNLALPLKMELPHNWKWPRSGTRRWLSPDKIQAILAKSLSVVPRKPYYWDLTDFELDKELLAAIDQPGECRVELLRTLKTMRDEFWRPEGKQWDFLKSYVLENLLFWECEKHPDPSDWMVSKRTDRFKGIMSSLMNHLERKFIPHYFDPFYNLLSNRPADEIEEQLRTLKKFMEMPVGDLFRK